jgi:hypothetical protein
MRVTAFEVCLYEHCTLCSDWHEPYEMLCGFCPRLPLSNMNTILCDSSEMLTTQVHVQSIKERKQRLQYVAKLTLVINMPPKV